MAGLYIVSQRCTWCTVRAPLVAPIEAPLVGPMAVVAPMAGPMAVVAPMAGPIAADPDRSRQEAVRDCDPVTGGLLVGE